MTERRPPPPPTSPTMALVVLGRILSARVETALEEVGLTIRDFGVMGHIEAEPGISISELARRSGVTAQSMHATVAALVSRQLVTRGPAGRGRTSHLAVTPTGHAAARRARRSLRRLDQRLFADADVDVWAAAGLRLGALADTPRGRR